MLKFALVISMLFQLGAAVFAISLIRRTRYNVSWILISAGLVLMALRRLFEYSNLFWESRLFQKEEINGWIGVLISVVMLVGVVFIRKIFNLQDRIDQMRLESEQKVLSAVIQTEDKARQAFAQELHDGLGPLLSSIKMTLSAVDEESLTRKNGKILASACNASDNAILTLKEISNNLSPHLLKNFGLGKAIETTTNRLFSAIPVRLELSMDFDGSHLSEELKISCYRIVAELMNNSLKHAQPAHVKLEIKESDRRLWMRYSDDGCGFDYTLPGKPFQTDGMGLNNIFSRTKSLQGTHKILTAPGKGFKIELQFPLK